MPKLPNINMYAGVFSRQENYRLNKIAIYASFVFIFIYLLFKLNVFEVSAKTDFSSESGTFFYGKPCPADLWASLDKKGAILEPVFFCLLIQPVDGFIGALYGGLGQPLNYLIMGLAALAISFMAIKVLTLKAQLNSEFYMLAIKLAVVFSLSLSYESLANLCNFVRSITMGIGDGVTQGVRKASGILPTGQLCASGTSRTVIGEMDCMIRGLLADSGLLLILTFLLWFVNIGWGVDMTLKVLGLFVTLIFVAVRIIGIYFISFVGTCLLLVFLPIFGTLWFFQVGKRPFQTYIYLIIGNMILPILMTVLLTFTFLAVKQSFVGLKAALDKIKFEPTTLITVTLQNALGGLFGGVNYGNLNTNTEKIGKFTWYGKGPKYSCKECFLGGIPACSKYGAYNKTSKYGLAVKDVNSDGSEQSQCGSIGKVINLDKCTHTYSFVYDTGTFYAKNERVADLTEALMDDLSGGGQRPGLMNGQILFGEKIKQTPKCGNSKPSAFLTAYCQNNSTSFTVNGYSYTPQGLSMGDMKREVLDKLKVDICDFSGTGTLPNNQANAGNKGLSGISSLGCTSPIPESVKGCIYAMGPEDRTIVKTELSKIDKESISDDEKKKKKQTYLKNVYDDLFNNYTPSNKRDGKLKLSSPQDDTFNVCINKINNFLYERSGAGNESVKKCWELFDLYNTRGADDAIVKAKLKDKASVDYCLSKDACSGDLRSCMLKYINDPLVRQGDVANTDCTKLIYNKKPINTTIDGKIVSLKNVDFIEERCLAMDTCARTDGFLDSLDKSNPDQKIEDTGDAEDQKISNEEFGDITGTFSIPIPTSMDEVREISIRILVVILIFLVAMDWLKKEGLNLFDKILDTVANVSFYKQFDDSARKIEDFVNNNPNAQEKAGGEKVGLIRRAANKIGRTRN